MKALRETFGGNAICAEGIDELEAIIDLTKAAGFGEGQIMVDPSVVRGLEYYTGPVFEAELTFEVQGEDGKAIRFGSVGGGGRYDGLVGRFRGENVPATGFSIGVSRLFAALKAIHSPIVTSEATHGPVIVLVLDQPEIARYQGFVSKLRAAGIRAELYLGSSGMNAQLKICRQARIDVRRHPGLERAREKRSLDPRSRARRRTRGFDQGPRGLSGAACQGAIHGGGGSARRGRARGAKTAWLINAVMRGLDPRIMLVKALCSKGFGDARLL